MPGIALGEGIAPFERAERSLELAVLVASTHQIGTFVKNVAVVEGMFAEGCKLFLRFAESLAKLVDAPVVVGIFESSGYILVYLYVVGHIAELVVILEP